MSPVQDLVGEIASIVKKDGAVVIIAEHVAWCEEGERRMSEGLIVRLFKNSEWVDVVARALTTDTETTTVSKTLKVVRVQGTELSEITRRLEELGCVVEHVVSAIRV